MLEKKIIIKGFVQYCKQKKIQMQNFKLPVNLCDGPAVFCSSELTWSIALGLLGSSLSSEAILSLSEDSFSEDHLSKSISVIGLSEGLLIGELYTLSSLKIYSISKLNPESSPSGTKVSEKHSTSEPPKVFKEDHVTYERNSENHFLNFPGTPATVAPLPFF